MRTLTLTATVARIEDKSQFTPDTATAHVERSGRTVLNVDGDKRRYFTGNEVALPGQDWWPLGTRLKVTFVEEQDDEGADGPCFEEVERDSRRTLGLGDEGRII